MRERLLGLLLVTIPLSVMSAETPDVQASEAFTLIDNAKQNRTEGYFPAEVPYRRVLAMPILHQPIALELAQVLDKLLTQFLVLVRVGDENLERSLRRALHESVRRLPGNGKCLPPDLERRGLLIAPLLLGDLRD